MVRHPRVRRRRLLHPGAWWLWAGGLAAAAMQTTNPILLGGIVAVAAFVVAARRQPTPWARSFGGFLKLGLFLIAFRVVMQVLFGQRIDGTVLFTLPSIQLPDVAAGVVIGGPVTLELVVDAIYTSMRLATVLVCFGSVNALCSPYRLLRTMPAAIYEAGVVVTVSLSFAPQLIVAIARVREARRLRGRPTKGLRGIRGMALPVLEDALERSVALAASMDARGYGRRGDLTRRSSIIAAVATIVGIMALCVGVYALLDVGAPPLLRLPMLAIGSSAVAVALIFRGRHSQRTRFQPDPWGLAEWLVAAAGIAVLGAFVIAARTDPSGLTPSVHPLVWPAVSVLAALGVAMATIPAWAAPPPPSLLGRAERPGDADADDHDAEVTRPPRRPPTPAGDTTDLAPGRGAGPLPGAGPGPAAGPGPGPGAGPGRGRRAGAVVGSDAGAHRVPERAVPGAVVEPDADRTAGEVAR